MQKRDFLANAVSAVFILGLAVAEVVARTHFWTEEACEAVLRLSAGEVLCFDQEVF